MNVRNLQAEFSFTCVKHHCPTLCNANNLLSASNLSEKIARWGAS